MCSMLSAQTHAVPFPVKPATPIHEVGQDRGRMQTRERWLFRWTRFSRPGSHDTSSGVSHCGDSATAGTPGWRGGGGGGHLCDPASPVTHSEHSRFVPDVIICNRSHAAIAGNSLHATASMRQETDRPATWGAWTRLPGLTPRLPLLRRPGGRGRHACPSGASPHSFLLPYPVLLPSWLRSRPVRTVARRGLRVPPIAGVWVSATSVRFVS